MELGARDESNWDGNAEKNEEIKDDSRKKENARANKGNLH